ncbi:MAG TPA: hypothetical protein VL943_13690, partial [Niabella sp.]|nr:hypothetical protein [Niabella sp.]
MVAAFLATTSLSSVLSVNAQKTSGKSSFRTEQGAASLKPALQDGDSLKYKIQGSVTDSVSKNPLAGVSIFIGGRVMGITDADGRYSFIVPLEYRKPIVEITAEKMGSHEPVKDIIRLKKLPAELNFILTVYECKSTVIISSGIIVIKPVEDKSGAASKREPWYRKMLNRPAG